MSLEIKKLYKYFGEKLVLKNINIKAINGERLGFLGINGSGKTTLLNSIYYREFKTSGEVNRYYSDYYDDCVFIKDQPDVYNYLTVDEYYEFFKKMVKSSDLDDYSQRYGELKKGLKLEGYKEVLIKDLSFGNKRKLYIASLLSLPSRLYLIDEPTNGLDTQSIIFLREFLKSDYFAESIVLLSSHLLEFVEKVSIRYFVLSEGLTEVNSNQCLESTYLSLT